MEGAEGGGRGVGGTRSNTDKGGKGHKPQKCQGVEEEGGGVSGGFGGRGGAKGGG